MGVGVEVKVGVTVAEGVGVGILPLYSIVTSNGILFFSKPFESRIIISPLAWDGSPPLKKYSSPVYEAVTVNCSFVNSALTSAGGETILYWAAGGLDCCCVGWAVCCKFSWLQAE